MQAPTCQATQIDADPFSLTAVLFTPRGKRCAAETAEMALSAWGMARGEGAPDFGVRLVRVEGVSGAAERGQRDA